MSDNKQYYFIRLKDHFFDSEEVVILESMPDGFLYSNILLKLYLRSLKNRGRLMVCDYIPYNSDMLSRITRHPVAVVEKALQLFINLGLVEILDNGAIYMLNIEEFIGKASTEADRKRKTRMLANEEKQRLRNNCGQMSGDLSGQISTINITTNRDKDIDKNINNKTELENVDNSDCCCDVNRDDLVKRANRFSVSEKTVNKYISKVGMQQLSVYISYLEQDKSVREPAKWLSAAVRDKYDITYEAKAVSEKKENDYRATEHIAKRVEQILKEHDAANSSEYSSDFYTKNGRIVVKNASLTLSDTITFMLQKMQLTTKEVEELRSYNID